MLTFNEILESNRFDRALKEARGEVSPGCPNARVGSSDPVSLPEREYVATQEIDSRGRTQYRDFQTGRYVAKPGDESQIRTVANVTNLLYRN